MAASRIIGIGIIEMHKYDSLHTCNYLKCMENLDVRQQIQKLPTSFEGDVTPAASLKYLGEVTDVVFFCD